MKFVVNGEQNQHILSQRLVVIYGKGELEPLTHGEKGKHTYRNAEVRMTKGEIRSRNLDFFFSQFAKKQCYWSCCMLLGVSLNLNQECNNFEYVEGKPFGTLVAILTDYQNKNV